MTSLSSSAARDPGPAGGRRRRRPALALALALGIVWSAPAAAQLVCNGAAEGFGGGVPAGWSIVGAPQGPAWGDRSACGERFNFTGAGGNAACVSSDLAGPSAFDAELRSPPFSLQGVATALLRYDASYQNFAGSDGLDVDLSADGGGSWLNLLSWQEDHGAFRALPGESVELDLTPFAGQSSLMLRWRYADPTPAAFAWYAQIDGVRLLCDVPPVCAVPPLTGQVADGGFESGTPSAAWTESSSNFGTPICTAADCGFAGARTGDAWAFLGGSVGTAETSAVEQSVVIEPGIATLTFYLWQPAASGNGTDLFRVLVDGQPALAVAEGETAYRQGYRRVRVNLSAFADGASHLLRFEAVTTGAPGHTNFFVDDVAIEVCDTVSGQPEIAVADVEILEGDSGTTDLRFVVRLSSPYTDAVSLDFSTADGSALAGSDYQATSGTVTLATGETEAAVVVPVFGDTDIEPDETFTLELSAPVNATLTQTQTTATILDDDALPQLSINDAAVLEGDVGTSDALFEVTLAQAATTPVRVDFGTADGTAEAGIDYLAAFGTLTFAPGVTSRIVTVQVVGDPIGEPFETFTVELTNPSNAELVDPQGLGTILNDDEPPVVSIADAVGLEGDGLSSQAVFALSLNYASHLAITVDFATRDGSATAGADYLAASGTVTFPPGETEQQVAVTVLGDTDQEGDEDFLLDLANPVNATLDRPTATAVIEDDDTGDGLCFAADLLIDGSLEDLSFIGWTQVSSNWGHNNPPLPPVDGARAGSSGFAVNAELRQDADVGAFADSIAAGEQLFRFEGWVLSENRINGVDSTRIVIEYRDAANLTVLDSFDSGEKFNTAAWEQITDVRLAPAGTRFIRVRLISTRYEGSSNNTWYDAISLRPSKKPALLAGDVTVIEGAGAPVDALFDLELTCANHADVTIDYATADGTATAGADYTAAAGPVTFLAGETDRTVAVQVLDDAETEPGETFDLGFSAGGDVVLAVAQVVGTILDVAAPTISIDDPTVVEGDSGTTDALFTISLSGSFPFDVAMDYATGDGSATAGSDYQATAGSLVFAPGETVHTVAVPVIGDELSEGDEDFFLLLASPVSASFADDTGRGLISNDDAIPKLSIEEGSVAEGDDGAVTAQLVVRLSRPSQRLVTAAYQTTEGATAYKDLDFEPAAGTVSVRPGELTGTIGVRVLGDTLPEGDERVPVVLSNPVNAALAASSAELVIVEDDAECVGPNLVENPSNEGSLSAGTPSGWVIAVGGNWSKRGGNSPTPLHGGSSFEPNNFQTVHELRQDVDVTPYATAIATGQQAFFFEGYLRSVAEDPGEIIVEFRDGAGGVLVSHSSGEIFNRFNWERFAFLQAAPAGTQTIRVRLRSEAANSHALFDALSLRSLGSVALSLDDVRVFETDPEAIFTVSLSCPAAGPVSVDFATANGSALAGSDYVATSGTLTFQPGEVALPVPVTVIEDAAFESDEQFFLDLANPSGAILAIARGIATIDGTEPAPPRIAITDARVSEGDVGSDAIFFELSLDRPASQVVTVNFATANATATAGTDYAAASGTVTFPIGSVEQDLAVEVYGDLEVEANETFRVNLSGPVGGTIADGVGIGTILDDDGVVTVAIANASIREADAGTSDLVFPVTLSRASYAADAVIDFFTEDVSAAAGEDYLPAAGSLVIPAGQTSGRVTVPILGDEQFENDADETFNVRLPSIAPAGFAIADGLGVGTILGDDEFINRYQATARGGLTFTGNALGLSGTLSAPGTQDAIGAFITTDTDLQVGTYPAGTTADWRLDSSAAVLDLPPGAEILHAELLWGGSNEGVNAFLNDPVTLTTPAGSQAVAPDPTSLRNAVIDGYTRWAEVTDLVAAGGAGTYEVGGVPAHLGDTDDDHAGWTLMVVYGEPTLPLRNFTLMLGNDHCHGFRTINAFGDVETPQRRPVSARFFVTAGDGDADRAGESFSVFPIGQASFSSNAFDLSGPNNPRADFFASQINGDDGLLDTRGTFGDLNHVRGAMIAGGRQGWDITSVDLTGFLMPGRTPVNVRSDCSDDHNLGAFGFQIDTEEVEFPTDVKSVDRSFARVGDVLTYGVDLRNTGSVDAENLVFTDPPPAGTSYVAGSFRANGTPVAGADPAAGVGLGTIPAGDDLAVSFQVQVDALAELPSEYRNRASWRYRYREGPEQPYRIARVTSNEVVTFNEDFVSIAIDDVTIAEGNAGQTSAIFTVTLSSPLGGVTVVDYATAAGTATEGVDYLAAAGTLAFASGELQKTISVPIVGDGLEEFDETFSVVLSSPQGVPFQKSVGAGTILNDDLTLLAIGDTSVIEGNSGTAQAVFTVVHNNVTGRVVSVQVDTADGTATAGIDYQARSFNLVFPPGVNSLDVVVNVIGDLVDEPDETFSALLSRPANAAIGDGQGVATIVDDDGPVAVSIGSAPTYEGDVGTSPAIFKISVPFPPIHDVTVDYATADGTAVAGTDYLAASGTARIAAGQTSTTITVEVIGNTVQNPNKSFFVNLTNPQPAHNVTIAAAQGLGTILDDEPSPQLFLRDSPDVLEGDAGTVQAVFQVEADATTFETMSATFETFNGTARAGSDFAGRTGTVSLAPGETSTTIVVDVNGDLEDEIHEDFLLRLTNPSGAFIGRSTARAVIRDDDDDGSCIGPNLIANGGCEAPLVDGEIPGWTEVLGEWTFQVRSTGNPKPEEGLRYFMGENADDEELIQDVDLGRYAARIDGPGLEFVFAGHLRPAFGGPTFARIVVEYRDGTGAVLDAADSGQLTGTPPWHFFTDTRPAPAGTRAARIRLLCGGSAVNDRCHYDGLSLRTRGVPVLSVGDAGVPEGDAGLGDLIFPVELSCAAPVDATADFATRDSGAVAGDDYVAASGSLTLTPGELEQTVGVQVLGDTDSEPDEELFLDLGPAGSVLLGDPEGRGLIVNDDAPALDLAICLDSSGSVDGAEWQLQVEGLARAVENPAVFPHTNSVRLTVFQFNFDAELNLGPVLVGADNFADVATGVRDIPQGFGATDMESCIRLATSVLGDLVPESLKQVIDLSTDGEQTEGEALGAANDAVSQGIDAINAIGIGNGIDVGFLERMVRPQPAGGNEGFVVVAESFEAYVDAIQEKIRQEVSPDLSVLIDDGVSSAVPGEDLTYQVVVANGGSGALMDVLLTDFLPAEILSPVYTPSEGSFDPATGEWSGVLLETGTSITLTVTGQIDPSATGTLTAEVTVSPPAGVTDLDPADNTASHTTPLALAVDLSIVKASVGDFIAGQPGAYVIDVSSAGPSFSAGPIQVADTLPAGVVFVAGGGAGWSCSGAGRLATCTHAGPLAAGASLPALTLDVLVDPAAPNLIFNTASVSAPEPDPAPVNNATSILTPVEPIPGLIVIDTQVAEPDAGTADLVFAVHLNGPSSLEITVDYATADGTATGGADYEAASGTLTFAPGEIFRTVTVQALGDLVYERDESFTLELDNPQNVQLVDGIATGTILENDPAPELSIDDVTVTEGDAGLTEALFTVTLAGSTAVDATVDFATADGTATAGGDYQAASGTLTVPAAGGSRTLAIQVIGDTDVEPDETFFVDLLNPADAVLADARGLGTILDDDLTPPELAASKTDALFADNDGDTAPSPGDELLYQIVISNGGSVAATGVALNDLVPAHTSIVAGSVTTTQGTITSEDPVMVDLGEIAGGAAATVTFRVLIDNPVPAGVMDVVNQGTVTSVELPAVLTDDPALGGDADPTETMIAAAPMLVAEKSDALAVDADGDTVPSPGDTLEYTVTLLNNGNTSATAVAFSDPIPADTSVVAGSVTTTQGTVDGEDPVSVTVGEIAGGGASVTITFRVVIDDPVPAGVMDVVNQGTATSAELAPVPTDDPDFGGDADPTVTMIRAEPELSVEKVDVLFTDADGDGVASPGDTLLYQIAIDNIGNTSATSVALSDPIPLDTAVEPGSVQTSQGTVTSEDPVTVELGEIAGHASATVSFRVVIDDPFPATALEVANQATVSSAELPAALSDDPDTPAADDPTATAVFITPEIAIADAAATETDAAATGLGFDLTLSVAPNRPVSVDFATADQTALAGADYAAAAGSVVFAPGETLQTIVVTGLDDAIDEPDETLAVDLGNPSGATLADAQAIGTLLDDDDPPALAIGDAAVAEGDAGSVPAVFALTLSAPSGFDVAVDFATSDGTATGGADYLAAAGTVTIPAGSTGGAISVDVLGDTVDELDETFFVALSTPVNAVLDDDLGLGTILDDDEIEISIDDVEVDEGNSGTADALFTVSLTTAPQQPLTIDFATADGTATAGDDYQATSGTLTIPAGSRQGTIAVPVIGDLLLEPDETFFVNLSGASQGVLADPEGIGTILDDELCRGPNLIANPGAEEPLEAGELPGWTEVLGTDWQPRFADPDPAEGVAYFFAGVADTAELRQDVDVAAYGAPIAGGDQIFRFTASLRTFAELPEDSARVVVEYRDVTNTTVLDAFDSGEISSPLAWQAIEDTRLAPLGTGWIRVRLIATRYSTGADVDGYFDGLSLASLKTPVLSIGDAVVTEGDSGTMPAVFPLTLSCPTSEDVTVTAASADGTAIEGDDYLALPPTAVTLPAGAASGSVTVSVIGDLIEEADEHFFVDLTNPVGAVLVGPEAVGLILDDDGEPFCPRTPGYWKNHSEAWPVLDLDLGGVVYGFDALMGFLGYGGPDASMKLARHLSATKFNLLSGSEPSIVPVVDQSDAFLTTHPPGSNPKGAAKAEAEALQDQLDVYNNADCEEE